MSAWMQFIQPTRAQAMTPRQEPIATPVQQQQPGPTPFDWGGAINNDQNSKFFKEKIGQPVQGLWNKVSEIDMSAPLADPLNGQFMPSVKTKETQAKPAPTPVGQSLGMTVIPPKPQVPVNETPVDEYSEQLSVSQRVPSSSGGQSMSNPGSYEQQIEQALMGSIKKHQGNAERAQSEYDQLGEKPSGLGQVDWTPLLAMTDQWNGTNLTKSYTAPTGRQEFDKKKLLLQGALEKADGTVTESQLAYLKMKADERRAQENDEMRKLMYGQQFNNTIEKEVRDMRENVEPLQDILNSIGEVENTLGVQFEKYDEKTGLHNGQPVNVPGKHIPGVGHFTFHDKDARDLDAKISAIFNKTLLTRSGATVSNREMENLRVEFMNGRFNTPQEKLKALKQYEAASKRAMQNVEGAYRGQVKGRYQERGGQTLNQFAPQGGQQPSGPKPGDVVDGMTFVGGDPSQPGSWR